MNTAKVLPIADLLTAQDQKAARLILNTSYNQKHRLLFIHSQSNQLCVKQMDIHSQAEVGKAYESVFLDIKNIMGTLSDLEAKTIIQL